MSDQIPTDDDADQYPLDDSALDKALDGGFAAARADEAASSGKSVLERIGDITGSKPEVLLRDESAGDPPMLKPLAPDDRLAAGKYAVQGELGRGGVGAVHRGHDQDLGRDVAMKFLHEKYKEDGAILHRFVEEAQIGGQLQHPGIVPVYDLGMADGKPFFAMKLVKGQTLSKKLAERSSPTDDARTFLAIFEDVCQTLAYAHTRGVVHRDLKPANIMIGSFGEVQVVDWGMGKVLSTGGVADEKLASERQAEVSVIETVRSDGHGSQSIVGSVMGTPAYMPPEQARGDVDAMDERSDVFALGAILCEILTGQPPYVTGSNDAGELIAMAGMAKLDDANARLAGCGAEPELVELATRCLMPAPAARPRSAEVVAKTVHDHLAAVEARVHDARVEAAEAKVRAASLKRTQKLGIGLTAVIAAGLLVSLWFWREAKTAAENERLAHAAAEASAIEARENEQVAKRELARAVEIKNLITGMLKSVAPEQALGADTSLLEGILDTASKKLWEGAIQDELVAAELHAVTGNVYHSIGLYPEAERHLPVALEIHKRVLGEEHPDTLRTMGNLADLYLVQGRYAEAESFYLETLEIQRRVLGEEHPSTLAIMGNLALLYSDQGRYQEAEPLTLETLRIKRRALGEGHPDTLDSMNNLAITYKVQGRFEEAETLMLETLRGKRRVLGEEHPSTLRTMGNLAGLYKDQSRYAEAESLNVETLEIQRRVLGEVHPETLAITGNLANLYSDQGRFQEAETLMLETLRGKRRVLGEEHPSTLNAMSSLATLYNRQGRYAEAEPIYLETLEIQRRVLGEEHPSTLPTMGNLAVLYSDQGRYAAAEPIYIEMLEIQRRVLGEEHPITLIAMNNLANLYSDQGRYAEAVATRVRAVELARRVEGESSLTTVSFMRSLAWLYEDEGRLAEAEAAYRELIALRPQLEGEARMYALRGQRHLVDLLLAEGRHGEAEPLAHELVEVCRLELGEEHLDTLKAITRLARAWGLLGRVSDGEQLLAASYPVMQRVLGTEHTTTDLGRMYLIEFYQDLGRPEEAVPLYRERLAVELPRADQPDASCQTLNEAAWSLLVVEDHSLRDPQRALGYAERALILAEHDTPFDRGNVLDTLALAHYQLGDLAAAVEAQRRALSLMTEGADPDMAKRLAEYEAALEGK